MTKCAEEPIGRLIYKTSLDLRNYAEKLLNPYGLTMEQFHILKSTSTEAGISQSQLCVSVGKKPANITRLLDRLEKKGWIERQPNPADRRSSLVYLTEEGGRIIAEVSNEFESYASWFVEGIGQEEELVFRRVLEKINDNIEHLVKALDEEKA
ncbi:MAG TPA: MarR family transcriptional regulator [Desulfopila sp.]|nr:MarR family transcriptional regulator [Desulfopila sp.]